MVVSKIILRIKTKTGIRKIFINKSNKRFYVYNRSLKAYVKKTPIAIKHIRFIASSKKKDKLQRKKVIRVVKVRKEKIIHAKTKPIKKASNFNYKAFFSGMNHNGYVRTDNISYVFDEDTLQKEVAECIKDLQEWTTKEYYSLSNPQRMSYVKLEYQVQLSNNMDDLRAGSNTTHVSFKLPSMLKQIEDIIYIIINRLETYVSINLYKITLVNYEFNSVLAKEE
jgi:hypothetical protein